MAEGHTGDPARWQEAFEGLTARIGLVSRLVESRPRVRDLVRWLLSDLPRKNCSVPTAGHGDGLPAPVS